MCCVEVDGFFVVVWVLGVLECGFVEFVEGKGDFVMFVDVVE